MAIIAALRECRHTTREDQKQAMLICLCSRMRNRQVSLIDDFAHRELFDEKSQMDRH